jgi:hypothetical protein
VGQPVKAVEKLTHVVLTDNCVDQIQGTSSVQKEDKRKRREQAIGHTPTKAGDTFIKLDVSLHFEFLVSCFLNPFLEDTLPAIKLNHLYVVKDFTELRLVLLVQLALFSPHGLECSAALDQDVRGASTDHCRNKDSGAKHV